MRSVHAKLVVVAAMLGLAGCGAAPSEVTRAPVTLGSSEKPESSRGEEIRPVQFFGDGGLVRPPEPPGTGDAGIPPVVDPFANDAGVSQPPSLGRDGGGLFL